MSDFRNKIRVSAIVSTYNAESYMQGCMEDLVRQSLFERGELEILIVDCNSPSNEYAIVRQFQASHQNISYLRLSERETLYSAWNIGIQMARGEYVTNANTDDRHREDALEVMANSLDENTEASLVYADVFRSEKPNESFEENSKELVYHYPEYFPPDVLMFCQIGCQPMWRKSVHQDIGWFDEKLKAAGDYEFNFRLALAGKRLLHIPEILGSFLERTDSISQSDSTSTDEQRELRNRYIVPEVILKLCSHAGFSVASADEQLAALHAVAQKALSFPLPWHLGNQFCDLQVYFTCICKGLELSPENIVFLNNFAFGLHANGQVAEAKEIWRSISGFTAKEPAVSESIRSNLRLLDSGQLESSTPKFCAEFLPPRRTTQCASIVEKRGKTTQKPTTVTHVLQGLSLGGGAGCALNIAKYTARLGNYSHKLISLEPIAENQREAIQLARDNDIEVVEGYGGGAHQELLRNSDIIHVHWWNSPVVDDFLRGNLPSARMLSWYHIAGHYAPHVLRKELLEFFDFNLAGSPFTAEAPAFIEFESQYGSQRAGMAYGPADFERLKEFHAKPHEGFRVGYIGTVDFQKLHEDFIGLCRAAWEPGTEFHVWGGSSSQQFLESQAKRAGIESSVHFRGFVRDVASAFSEIDVFGYPLREDTYAASELIIQEAMYCGVVPVVFPHGGLKRLVEHDKTGLVVHSKEEYGAAIQYLKKNPDERARLSEAAKSYAKENFGSEHAARAVHEVYQQLMNQEKSLRTLRDLPAPASMNSCPGALRFAASLGGLGTDFLTSLSDREFVETCQADARIGNASFLLLAGGIEPWATFHSKDPFLSFWAGLAQLKRNNPHAALEHFTNAQAHGLPGWRGVFYMALAAEVAGYHEQAKVLFENAELQAPHDRALRDALEIYEGRWRLKDVVALNSQPLTPA